MTRNSPTTYYVDATGGLAGLEHDLVKRFAKSLGFKVKFVVASQFDRIIPAVAHRQAHMAAAGLTITSLRKKQVRFGPPYLTVRQEVIYNTHTTKPKNIQDLIGKNIVVVAGSSYVARLEQLKQRYPKLQWHAVPVMESEELLSMVASGKADAAIVDSNILDIARNYYPDLNIAFPISGPQKLAWAFPKNGDGFLYAKAVAFFARIRKNGTLRRLIDRYYGHVDRLETSDITGILTKMNTLLPRYVALFHQAQEKTGIDWRLLAALSYQESHWDPLATSRTGVRGIMMLTNATADDLGVTNRLEPRQSIPAGARYLASIRASMPVQITEPDRTWMALAAYNVGYAHLMDARILAQRMKLDPNYWTNIKRVLPLLSHYAYYSRLKYGYARGGEAVIFVENIRTYYDILAKFRAAYYSLPPLSPIKTASK